MGREARCTASFRDRTGDGLAHLDGDRLTFRGPFRVVLARAEMTSITAKGDDLVVGTAGGEARFALGAKAAAWADALLHPKSRLDKLGVRPGSRVILRGVDESAFMADLRAAGVRIAARGAADLVFLAADSRADLDGLVALRTAIWPGGAVWVVSRKGPSATLKDTEVMAAARAAGLVDNKVIAFSATHTALRLVIPKAARRP